MAKARRPNQTVMQSVSHGRYKTVALAFSERGYSAIVSANLAYGVVARLINHVYVRLDDDLGSIADFEALAGWDGPRGRLVTALSQTSFIRVLDDRVYLTEAVKDAPHSHVKRWKRAGGYQDAVDRCDEAFAKKPAITTAVEEIGLFGTIENLQPKDEHERTEHSKLVTYWTALWSGTYAGKKYPFRPKDAAAVAAIRRFAGSYTDACNVLESFIAERADYFAGHDLSKCVQQLGRFIAKTVPKAAKRGEYGSQGGSIAADASTAAGREAIARRVARIEGARKQNDGTVGEIGLP